MVIGYIIFSMITRKIEFGWPWDVPTTPTVDVNVGTPPALAIGVYKKKRVMSAIIWSIVTY